MLVSKARFTCEGSETIPHTQSTPPARTMSATAAMILYEMNKFVKEKASCSLVDLRQGFLQD